MKQAVDLPETDRRKDEFLAILAHELRSHLSPLSNALQIWKFVAGDPQEMQQLQQLMQRQVQQMTRLIDDLLDVSRIARGKIELRKDPVSLAAVISDAVEAVRPLLDSSEHGLAIVIADDPLVVEGDAARLTQIFGNILQNAAKFTVRRGKIELSARRQGDEALVTIKDNGPGIPASLLPRIFDMFQPAGQTPERSHGGLGTGLTLAKHLVDLHGGRVAAHSEGPGKGSEFVVALPLMTPKPRVPEVGESAKCDLGPATLPSFNVLVVDDVPASAKTLALMLRTIGQHAEVVHDGSAVVQWVLEHRPDFVFLDIGMPGMSGYEVARQIRAHEDLRDICLIALTGYGEEDDRRRAIEAGFDQHLTKPASIDQLRQLLRGDSRGRQID